VIVAGTLTERKEDIKKHGVVRKAGVLSVEAELPIYRNRKGVRHNQRRERVRDHSKGGRKVREDSKISIVIP